MSIHVKGIDMGLWKVINNGYTLTVGTTAVPLIRMLKLKKMNG